MPHEVFISYRSEDKMHADRVCQALEADNLGCWIAPRNIQAGVEWSAAIVSALNECKAFILVLSSNSRHAKQISREAELADHAGVPILTLRVEDVQPPPSLLYFLGNLQWLDAFGANEQAAYAELPGIVRKLAATDKPIPDPTGAESFVAGQAPARPIPPSPKSDIIKQPEAAARKLTLPLIAGLAVVAVAAIAFFVIRSHKTPDDPLKAASAFGLQYLQERDSGDPLTAYNMTGVDFKKRWSERKYVSAVVALQKIHFRNQVAEGTCSPRERGALLCDYTAAFGPGTGTSTAEHLTIASKADGWQIASDPILNNPPAATASDLCKQGFVWREASPTDHVCVTPLERDKAARQNQEASTRRSPNGGPYGPDTCLNGFRWRGAFNDDHVCVTTAEMDEAAQQNSLADSRRVD